MDTRHSTSRRAFLRGALAVVGLSVTGSVLTACGPFSPPTAAPPAPELNGFLQATVALGASYDATIAAVPELAARLTPLRDEHRAHAQALAGAIGAPVPSPTDAEPAPTDRAGALAALITAEQTARDAAVTACLAGTSRVAALLASIAAARATHLEVLA